MRRILFAILVWVVLAGGLTAYMRHRDARPVERSAGRPTQAAAGRYDLELTPAFTPEPDPFALRMNDAKPPAPLSARIRGRELLDAAAVKPGVPLLVTDLPEVVAGDNEIVVTASPPMSEGAVRHLVHALVFRNGSPCAEETFWSDGVARIVGVVRFTAPKNDGGEGDK